MGPFMSAGTEDPARFSRWIARPQSLIALSAVLLSVCGVFIATYEAALVRRQQRASAWPHVEVAASMSRGRVELWVQNVGVGPARVRTAAVSQGGETRKDWADLIRRAGVDPKEVGSYYYSLINGRVLPPDSEREVIWRLTEEDGAAAPALIALLRREILEGQIDVTLCYCSVYDECWMSGLQDVIQRSRGVEAAAGDRAVDSCDGAPRSGI